MKVLIHSNFFYPSVGGVEMVSHLLARELARLGEEVKILTATSGNGITDKDFPYKIVRCSSRTECVKTIHWSNVIMDVGPAAKWLGVYKKSNIPVILIFQGPHGACPIAIGWKSGIRCSFQLHKCITCNVIEQSIWNNIRFLARYYCIRKSIQEARGNVFASKFLLDRTRETVPVENYNYIYNPYDEHCFNLKENTPLPGPDSPITFVGRLVSIKGVDLLLEGYSIAVKRGLRRSLRIIGDGPLRAHLMAMAERLGISGMVQWVGIKQGVDLATEYRMSAVGVVPTTCEEAFGIVCSEAMACGTPILVNRRGALPEVVARDEWCVEPNAVAWSDALLRIPSLSFVERAELVKCTFDRFSSSSRALAYQKLLNLIVNGTTR